MSYRTVLKEEKIENEIKKSRFLGFLSPVSTEDEAIAFIDKVKKNHPDARHWCFAYVIGEKKYTQRYSDDGEPSGTAGIPMLELINKKDLTDICVVVVRYFGGILLGAGGLVRAYSGACNDVCNKATIVEKKAFIKIDLELDYNNYGRLLNYIEENKLYIQDKVFESDVILKLYIDRDIIEKAKKDFLDLTSGNIKVIENEMVLLNTIDNKLYIEE